jgi:hypothetical protein
MLGIRFVHSLRRSFELQALPASRRESIVRPRAFQARARRADARAALVVERAIPGRQECARVLHLLAAAPQVALNACNAARYRGRTSQ